MTERTNLHRLLHVTADIVSCLACKGAGFLKDQPGFPDEELFCPHCKGHGLVPGALKLIRGMLKAIEESAPGKDCG